MAPRMAPAPGMPRFCRAPLLGLVLLGLSRWPTLGRFVAAPLVLLFGYVLAATYAVKLIPLYGGAEQGRASLACSDVALWSPSSEY